MAHTTWTLYDLNSLVRSTLEAGLPDDYWVEAELSDVSYSRGHCYMELIQKDEGSPTPIARARAICWQSRWQIIGAEFERVTGQRLHKGIKVLLNVSVNFHEAYGFSWLVNDMDPAYTMGDMMRKRQEIIKKLKEEGVFDLQKELSLPLFAQRVAVISSESAAGYGDFCNQLTHNDYGFSFRITLFPSIMQGEGVEQGVIAALNAINHRIDDFDVVVIIRGGGATADLSGFDTLLLAENVANFPLPIITGIGHDRDESILDMVSHTRVKTPTAAAAFLVDNLLQVSSFIMDAQQRITSHVRQVMETEKLRLSKFSERIPSLFGLVRTRQEALLDNLFNTLATCSREILQRELHRLELLEQRADATDPRKMLRRGYSITKYKGSSLRDGSNLHSGDEIETILEKTTLKSIIK